MSEPQRGYSSLRSLARPPLFFCESFASEEGEASASRILVEAPEFSLQHFEAGERRRLSALRHYALVQRPVLRFLNAHPARSKGPERGDRETRRVELEALRKVDRSIERALGAELPPEISPQQHQRRMYRMHLRRLYTWDNGEEQPTTWVALLEELSILLRASMRLALPASLRPTWVGTPGDDEAVRLILGMRDADASTVPLRLGSDEEIQAAALRDELRAYLVARMGFLDDSPRLRTQAEERAAQVRELLPLYKTLEGHLGFEVLHGFFVPAACSLPLDLVLWAHALNFTRVEGWRDVLRICPYCLALHTRPGARYCSDLHRWAFNKRVARGCKR